MRAAVEVRDYGGGRWFAGRIHLQLGPGRRDPISSFSSRVMEGLGRAFRGRCPLPDGVGIDDRPAAMRGRAARNRAAPVDRGDMKRDDAAAALRSLTTSWRGDETEAEALQLLGRIYAEDGHIVTRSGDAYGADGLSAVRNDARASTTRRRWRSRGFSSAAKGDSLPPIDALSLFYDYRDLTPVGQPRRRR